MLAASVAAPGETNWERSCPHHVSWTTDVSQTSRRGGNNGPLRWKPPTTTCTCWMLVSYCAWHTMLKRCHDRSFRRDHHCWIADRGRPGQRRADRAVPLHRQSQRALVEVPAFKGEDHTLRRAAHGGSWSCSPRTSAAIQPASLPGTQLTKARSSRKHLRQLRSATGCRDLTLDGQRRVVCILPG